MTADGGAREVRADVARQRVLEPVISRQEVIEAEFAVGVGERWRGGCGPAAASIATPATGRLGDGVAHHAGDDAVLREGGRRRAERLERA